MRLHLVTIKVSILTVCLLFAYSITKASVNNRFLAYASQLENCKAEKTDTANYVSGKVMGKDGFPVPFVNVSVDGANYRTTTDFEGVFYIRAQQNDVLVVAVIGMKSQRLRVAGQCMDILLEEIEEKDELGPPSPPYRERHDDFKFTEPITTEDIKHAGKPKYDFTKNAKKNIYIVYVSDLKTYEFNQEDQEFQKRYMITYSITGSYSLKYMQAYNRLTYRHLQKNVDKAWYETIRKDAIGLEIFLK